MDEILEIVINKRGKTNKVTVLTVRTFDLEYDYILDTNYIELLEQAGEVQCYQEGDTDYITLREGILTFHYKDHDDELIRGSIPYEEFLAMILLNQVSK